VIRVLVTGSRGQVGAQVVRAFEGRADVVAHDRTTLDLAKPEEIAARIREARPDVVVNAAAYTAVDRAEAEPDRARVVNANAPRVIAGEAKRAGALLIHFSTDYVFDGAQARPYVETDSTGPLNVYGLTKLEGEQAIAASGCPHAILRTSWVYGPRGNNFMLTMLRLAATRRELRVVDDQRGAPTSSRELARATLALFTRGERTRAIASLDVARVKAASGLYHASAAGETTWCGFAQAIFELRSRQAGPRFTAPRLVAIASGEYPTAARRPANSVLSSAKLAGAFGIELADWRQGLEEALSALAAG
jgi:dTDP-4-dehydrorhamnose reductase